jgi:hypothetical protein
MLMTKEPWQEPRNPRPNPGSAVMIGAAFSMALVACNTPRTFIEPDGGRIPIPAACELESSAQRPFSVTFRLHNGGGATVFTHVGCLPPFEVSSCASAYTDQIANLHVCGCICGEACPACGACPEPGGAALAPAGALEWRWTALLFAAADPQSCATRVELPAGRYRARVPLFATEADATADTPLLRAATADFELPAANDTVDIEAE